MRSIFQQSNKKNLLLTGSKKVGKTTLLREAFPENDFSLISSAVMLGEPHPDRILLEFTGCRESTLIGRYGTDRMEPIPSGFAPAVKAIENFIAEGGGRAMVDEIGFLESACPEYQQALIKLFDSTRVVACIRKQDTDFILRLKAREDVLVVDLDRWYGREVKIGCVVMASGFSTRFHANKLLAEFEGKPMAAHLLEKLSGLPFLDTVVVTRYPELESLAKACGCGTVLHNERSLSDTIRLGIESLPPMDGYMLCVADQPFLKADTVAALAARFRYSPDKIIRVRCGDTPGNPVLFPGAYRQELMSLQGETGGRAVIKAHPEALLHLDITDSKELFDIDTPDALKP